MSYGSGKTLAQTGIAAAGGIGVLGYTVPWLAIVATGLVVVGAIALRVTHKVRATR